MNSASNQRDDNAPSDARPMLSPIRTSQPAPPTSAISNSTRLPFYAEQSSAHGWSPAQHYSSSAHPSSSSGLVHATLDQAPYHHQQPVFVASNTHDFTPRTGLGLDASSVPRFEESLSPVEGGPANQQQQQQQPSSSPPVSTKTARGNTTTTFAAGGARRGYGKPPVSVSSKSTAGSGSAGGSGASASAGGPGGRSSQPKSSRKQFSACGACQHRQLSGSSKSI